jgi:hypothetical protein
MDIPGRITKRQLSSGIRTVNFLLLKLQNFHFTVV